MRARRRPAGTRSCSAKRLVQHLVDRHARIERGVGILKDELRVAAEGAQFGRAKRQHVLAVKPHGARRSARSAAAPAGRRVDLPHPDLADQRQRLACIDREAHAVDRLHESRRPPEQRAAADEMLHQPFDLQQRRAHMRPAARSGRAGSGSNARSRAQRPAARPGCNPRSPADSAARSGSLPAAQSCSAPCPRWRRAGRRGGRGAGSSRAGRPCRDVPAARTARRPAHARRSVRHT